MPGTQRNPPCTSEAATSDTRHGIVKLVPPLTGLKDAQGKRRTSWNMLATESNASNFMKVEKLCWRLLLNTRLASFSSLSSSCRLGLIMCKRPAVSMAERVGAKQMGRPRRHATSTRNARIHKESNRPSKQVIRSVSQLLPLSLASLGTILAHLSTMVRDFCSSSTTPQGGAIVNHPPRLKRALCNKVSEYMSTA